MYTDTNPTDDNIIDSMWYLAIEAVVNKNIPVEDKIRYLKSLSQDRQTMKAWVDRNQMIVASWKSGE